MSDNIHRVMEGGSGSMAPVISQPNYDANVDYIISDYMERLGTRLNILETELKYAWRALDLLSQEYIKMWERLEKLENLLYEQQSVISQLLDFYTSGDTSRISAEGAALDGRLGELEVIREILGNGTVEDGLEEGVDVTRDSHNQGAIIQELDLDMTMDEIHVPDEAFYRSLNQAYRDDLVSETGRQSCQLGMIWEEKEDADDNNEKKSDRTEFQESLRTEDEAEIYSAMDYKDYRGNSPCISEQDIAQLTRISTIDHVAIEKLNELDRLSTKLQQDSMNIKQLQRKLLEPSHSNEIDSREEAAFSKESGVFDDQLRQIYDDSENWSFSSGVRDHEEMILISKSEIPSSVDNIPYTNRPSSRLSVSDSIIGTDTEVAETLAGGLRTPTSPRRRQIEVASCSAPYTTVTGRLAYSAAVQNADAADAAAAAQSMINSKNPFYSNNTELNSLIAASYETVPCSSPAVFNIKSEKAQSPTLSICSIRTRQDGYICSAENTNEEHTTYTTQSPSPPPPAPQDICEPLISGSSVATSAPTHAFLGNAEAITTSSITSQDYGRLSPKTPHSPKSPRTSPKRSKSRCSNIVAAKSDSGLSSMSGWSSLEKSPGSPKNGSNKPHIFNFFTDHGIPKNQKPNNSPSHAVQYQSSLLHPNTRPYPESEINISVSDPLQVPVCTSILPGGHHLSAFTTVKSPCSLESEGYGTFVPAPAPASDINVSPRKKSKHQASNRANSLNDFTFRNSQPAIYSVAGSNRDSFTSVYTSNSGDYAPQTVNYPDLVEPYENNELLSRQPVEYSYQLQTMPSSNINAEAYSRTHPSNTDGVANHEGYKTAMCRTMFPTGNITDALSYYPTSTRYDSAVMNLPQADYNDPSVWLNYPQENQFHDSASTSSSMRSMETSENTFVQSPYMDKRKYSSQQAQRQGEQKLQNVTPQPLYENQRSIDQYNKSWNQRQEIPYLELDLRNRNVPDYIVQQQYQERFYDPSGVIVSQSGYLSISSNINDSSVEEKPSKKVRRVNTLKSAMNSVSHWLPDLHLTKRHRSYSLPSGAKREELTGTNLHPGKATANNSSLRKKKKNVLVSTVSGILQKAKRKTYTPHTQSLSDPEQSENEWVLNRASSVLSEDDKSEDSCSVFSEFEKDNVFAKVVTNKPKQKPDNQNDFEDETVHSNQFEMANSVSPKMQNDTTNKSDQELEVTDGYGAEEEVSGKSTGSASSGLFPTIGDVKKSSAPSEKSDDSATSESRAFPQVPLGGASMEFAVSRALGKYRQQRQSTISDDQDNFVETDDKEKSRDFSHDDLSNTVRNDVKLVEIPDQKPVNNETIENNKLPNEEHPIAENSPASSLKNHAGKFFPRHQQSLEIPGMRSEDDDNKSTHSWRSGSRVSSRRQSTEDSIDSEDEWYVYELRKLEEMENKHTQIETDIGEPLVEEPEDSYEPCEEVKEKMSFVLRELRMKARPVEGVLDAKDNNRQVLISAKARDSNRKASEPLFEFAKVTDYQKWRDLEAPYQEEEIIIEEVTDKDEEREAEHSSGDTSGPDSPHHSTDEYDDGELPPPSKEFARCYIGTENSKYEEPEEAREAEVSYEEKDNQQPPQIKVDDANKDDLSKESGPLGSKWKLLKALKERKAEEKSNQDKITEPAVEKDKVSMLGMVQKFYEIHVKT